jgi:hypothetical protein
MPRSFSVVFVLMFLSAGASEAAPLDPNNILVALKHEVREYTPAGVLVQTIQFNYGGRDYPYCCPSAEELHGIVVDQYGWIDSFNGTWYPFMSRYLPDSNAFVHKTFPDWSATGSTYSGHLTTWRNFVFAADAGSNLGLVRFDVFSGTAARFSAGRYFIDVKAGLDGKLYALSSSSADIYVYDPSTMQQLGYFAKPPNIAWMVSLAVDQTGCLFVGSNDGTISRLSNSGAVEATVSVSSTGLMDISMDETGRLVVANIQGKIFVGDASLVNGFSSFTLGDPAAISSCFVSFAHAVPPPIEPVPTPIPTPVPTPTPSPTHDIVVSLGAVVAGVGNSEENSVREFTPDGSLLRNIHFNYNGGPYPITESLRAIAVDQNGAINAFNGTFSPVLTRFDWNCTSFSHTSFPGWSLVNSSTLGGIGIYQSFVFATDMATYNSTAAQANGIVRFDITNNTAARFAQGTDFWHLNVGLDGRLYTMPSGGGLNVYDPVTMQLLKHLTLPVASGKFAIDQNGIIFMTSAYGTVYRLDNIGQLQASVATGFPHLTDIKIDETGHLVMVSDEGYVITGDTSLSNFSWFPAIRDGNTWMINVAFAPLAPAPPVGLVNVASRKIHGIAGTFDICFPPIGKQNVECRSGGSTGDYTLVFSFIHDVLSVGGVCCNGATLRSSLIDPDDSKQYIVNVTGVTNATRVTVTLDDVDGSEGTHNDTVEQEIDVLIGDTTGNGAVNSSDISLTQSQSGQPVTALNFREDVTVNGAINSSDVSFVQSLSGSALGSAPMSNSSPIPEPASTKTRGHKNSRN